MDFALGSKPQISQVADAVNYLLANIGSSGGSYTLPVATATVLGGVKEGAGVTIAPDGTISTTGSSSGNFGTATIDFGGFPGSNEASIAVTGEASILGTSKCQAFIMSDDTSLDHTASDHKYVGIWLNLTCGTPTAGIGFTIYGRSSEKLNGKFSLRWTWAN